MAFKKKLAALTAVLIIPQNVSALQVSPSSPCAPVCLDSESTDSSDKASSNTRSSDIVCKDADYTGSAAGVKWKNCMSCLQKSTFSQGDESDQGWFLYNMRYSFNYCTFGYPNNTQIGSNPCQTSRACGALKNALIDGSMDPEKSTEYGYCTADSGSMTGEFYDKCLSCISAFRDQVVVTNSLVALEAGCLQRPAPGKTLALNDTIFSTSRIGILSDDTADSNGSSTAQGGSTTPTTTLVVAIISGVLGLAAIAAMIYLCVRKRRNARRRAAAAEQQQQGWGHGGWGDGSNGVAYVQPGGGGPQSPLSFRCQTQLSPTSPRFFGSPIDEHGDEKLPARQYITSQYSPSMEQQQQQHAFFTHAHHMPPSDKAAAMGLYQLTTTSLPAPPANARQSPHTARGSPVSATPTSATQLLPGSGSGGIPYVPAEYSMRASTNETMSQQWGWPGQPQQQQAPVPSKSPKLGGGRSGFGRRGSIEKIPLGPVESKQIQMTFPGPPGQR